MQYRLLYMPTCPCCKSNSRVKRHAFHDKHFGRLVISQKDKYTLIGSRYWCWKCKEDNEQSKISFKREEAKMKAQAEAMGVEVEIKMKRSKIQYTFMGWDRRILPLFANGVGAEFPAFLTKRAGLDLSVIDWMIPLFDKGVKGQALEEMLLEFHTKAFYKRGIRYEHDMSNKRKLNPSNNYSLFGEFDDKSKYNGQVPKGKVRRVQFIILHIPS